MPQTMTIGQLTAARGQPVYSADGDKIGKIEDVFVDQETGEPEWLGVSTGMLGTKRVLVPVTGASSYEDGFQVPYASEQVKQTPDIDADEISQENEAELYSHYGLQYSERRSDTGLPEGAPQMPAGTGATSEGIVGTEEGLGVGTRQTEATSEGDLVRSEEELRVGTRDTETGRARLRKWVETEPVQEDVELRRETAHVTREPIDQPVSGAELGEQEVEVPLRQEEPVVEKETIAKERIGLEKDVTVDRETVTDEVRKERVDVEREAGA